MPGDVPPIRIRAVAASPSRSLHRTLTPVCWNGRANLSRREQQRDDDTLFG
jgi:hypothetical protein